MHGDYENTKKQNQLFADKADQPVEWLTRQDLCNWCLGQHMRVYKVDQASGQWQRYSLDDHPTAVGGREHVLPLGTLYIDPHTEKCGCEYFF